MPSFKSRMFNFMMRNRHLFQGKLKKPRFDMSTSIDEFRDQCERGAERFAKLPDGLQVKPVDIDGMAAEWLIPSGVQDDKVILYVHGGGYVSGSCNDHRAIIAKFADYCGYTNLIYEYRLAPEFPFPAAVDDSVRAYEWLLANGYDAQNILVAGESAGGGLALALLLALKKKGLTLPAAAVAISPWTDLTCSGESYQSRNKVSVAPLDSWSVFAAHYAGDANPQEPLISPLYGDLAGLPPLFINSGMDDELYDDGERFSRTAQEAGVDVQFRAGERQVHCYPLLAPMFKEATEAMDEICAFIQEHLG